MEMTPDERALCYQALAQVVLADATLTDAESAYLARIADRLQLPEAQRAAILHAINLGAAWDARLKTHLSPSTRRWLLQESIAAASSDGRFEVIEAKAIERLRAWLDDAGHDEP